MTLDGTPDFLLIRSNSTLTDLQITGHWRPCINYMWPAIFVHDLTDVSTILTHCARITLYQAFLLRTIVTQEYVTFIYLMHNGTIQPVLPSKLLPPSTAFLYTTAPAAIVPAGQGIDVTLYPTLPVE